MQTGRANRFTALAGQAVAAAPDQRAGLIAQAAQADPMRAVALSGSLDQQADNDEDRRNKTLINMSKLLVSVPDAYKDQVYQQIRPGLAKIGLTQAPQNYNEEIGKTAQSIVDSLTPLNAQPSGLREKQAVAAAAGLKPGTPEYEKAMRIDLGLDARAVTGAARMVMVKGADGRERPAIFDPSTGQVASLGDDGWSSTSPGHPGASDPTIVGPIQTQAAGGGQSPPSNPPVATAAPSGAPGNNDPVADANRWLAQGVPEKEVGVRLSAKYNGQLGGAQYPTVVIRGGQAFAGSTGGTPEAQPVPNSALTNLIGRPAEAEAGAVQGAKNAADLAVLPQKLKLESDAAVDQAGRKAAVEADVAAHAKQNADLVQRTKDANDTLSLLDEAEKILPDATGSKAGQAIDDLAAVGGKSTVGARATAQLQAIAGQITAKMPRMQGPQSDSDVVLYKQMAGDLANPDRPVETRLAALQVIRRLQKKYANQQAPSAGQTQAGGQPNAPRAVNPTTGKAVVWNGSAWVPE